MCANHGVAVGRSAATVAHTNLQTVFLAFSFGFRNLLCSTTLNMRLNVDAVGQIRCFGVNATSPRAREPGSTCGDLIQAYLLVSSMAQAATLSMYPSSWISKIGRHVNTSRIESFEFSQLPALRCVASPERLYCVTQLNRPLQPIDFQRIDLRAIC